MNTKVIDKCVAAYGARCSSYAYPGLPAWANSFRASGAEERQLVIGKWQMANGKWQMGD